MSDEKKELVLEVTKFIEVKDAETGKTLSGDFTMKRLTIDQIARMGAEISRRNGGLQVDDVTDQINTMIVQCQFSIVKKPDWFDPAKLYNMTVLSTVFEEVAKFERSFRVAVGS